MTIFSSLPKSPDVLSFLAGLEGGKSPKSVPSEGSDGFAELLDQLSAVLPADAEALGRLTGRQDAGLPGGKDLPVDLAGLPVAAEGTGGEAAADPQLGLAVVPLAAAHLALGSKTDNAGVATEAKAADPRAGVAITQASSAKEGDTAKAELKLHISAAPAPQDARDTQPSAQQHMRAAIELPLASAKPESPSTATSAERAAVAAPVAIRTGDTAASTGEGEGRANDDTAFADKTAAAPRAASNGEAAKPVAQAFTLPGAETSADVRPLSSSARPITSDQFANVERVVDQIMAARQADLSKPAAIAVAHREFGQLTVTFDRTADGMNVEVAAQDGETQRALAAAMANERPVARQHDGASIAANTTNANAPAGGERGSGTNASGNGAGHADTDERHAPGSDHRGSQGGSASQSQPHAAPSSSDGALYA